MRPGALSQDGFLGENEKLEDVLDLDARTVHYLGVSYEKLADRLEELIQASVESEERCVTVGHFLVKTNLFAGFQMCPWSQDIHHNQCTEGGGVKYGSVDWYIKNLITKKEMSGPGLITHLIRTHHFFEGIKSPRRVDPLQLALLLELIPSRTRRG